MYNILVEISINSGIILIIKQVNLLVEDQILLDFLGKKKHFYILNAKYYF